MFPRFLDGLGGTKNGSFFFPPSEDSKANEKPPGAVASGGPTSVKDALIGIATGRAFFYSPNVSWWLLSVLVYLVAPYDLSLSWQESLVQRLVVNHVLTFVYVGFWHVALYWWHWGERPFVPNRPYEWGKVLHNVWYTWLGVVQWSFTEVAFIRCYQTGWLEYVSDEELFSSSKVAFQLMIVCILVPPIRDFHFYFAHRILHAGFLYKYIHSLHHRNTDIEPFSGLCMHPFEHLYYYTCYAPILFAKFHPFVVFWMGVHAVITPAASHSGYEDHFSADLGHYLHHRYADCNYGAGIPFDMWFGTHRDRLKPSSLEVVPKDPKARLGWLPEHLIYTSSCGLVFLVGGGIVFQMCSSEDGKMMENEPLYRWMLAVLLSTAPCWIALLLAVATPKRKSNKSLLAPFDNDSGFSLCLHLSFGVALGVFPATYLLFLLFSSCATATI